MSIWTLSPKPASAPPVTVHRARESFFRVVTPVVLS